MREKQREINATDVEHLGSLVTGGLMLLSGFRRGGPLGAIFKVAGLGLVYRGQKGYRRLYDALGIALPAQPTGVGLQNVRVESQVHVRRSPDEVYRVWRRLSNLPLFMDHLLSVHEIDERRSLWTAKAPAGMVIKWDAEIINDVPGELLAWQTLEGSGVDNAGTVRFESDGQGGTLVHVVLRYDPPADLLGAWFAKLFKNDPQTQIDHDLQRFKQIMELGEPVEAAEDAPSYASRALDDVPAQSQPQADVL